MTQPHSNPHTLPRWRRLHLWLTPCVFARCLVSQGGGHAADERRVTQPPSNPHALPPLVPAPSLADAPRVRALPGVAGTRTCSR